MVGIVDMFSVVNFGEFLVVSIGKAARTNSMVYVEQFGF